MTMTRHFISGLTQAATLSAISCGLAIPCRAEVVFNTNPTQFVVCDKGVGSFEGRLPDFSTKSGITVTVRGGKKEGFSGRTCDIRLTSGKDETVVATNLAQADIDVMGADLGFGVPVVAFQLKATEADPTIHYQIYSLKKPVKLLRTIVGQDYFSAADIRLDGSVEIWTTDSGAINGFEHLPLRAYDLPPAVVLRFEKGKLIDVSSEYRPEFDRQIQSLRFQFDPAQIREFKASDGTLSQLQVSADGQPRGLLATKIRVIEIVWDYLESGREQNAWDTLDEMWPASDIPRIRAAIEEARARGLHRQVDGVSHRTEPPFRAYIAALYSTTSSFGGYGMSNGQRSQLADTDPRQILVRLPVPNNPTNWDQGRDLELVVDEAGKVRRARVIGAVVESMSAEHADPPEKEWIQDVAGWKYIPAFKDGHPRAFRCTIHALRDR